MKTRRESLFRILPGVALAGMLERPDRASAAGTLTIVGHAVHRSAVVGGPGGDVSQAWRQETGTAIEWQTFGVEAANERAFREASLAQGSVDIAFVLDRYTGPQFAGLFEDLNAWQARDPIPHFEEIPKGMLAAHTFSGKLTAIPFRHATHGLHVNTAILAERGMDGPPKTVEELAPVAEKLTFTRPDGVKVYGLVINLDDPATPMDWVRGFGGDFITPDYQVVVDQPGAVRAMTVMRDLFRKGVLPRNSMNLKTEDLITFMQQGRAAMTNNPFGRYFNYNDPKASKYPGKIAVGDLPLGVDGKPIPAKTSVWAMTIPRNGRNKDLAWSLIKRLSLPESTLREALNGNGPVRPSVYADPKLQALIPYAAAEGAALETARLVVPGFAGAGKAMDMFMEEMGNVLLGTKEPQAAMLDLKARVQPLLPT
jgi:multiple sugar transport system substrate-binding protein